jgi:hypothetical protein
MKHMKNLVFLICILIPMLKINGQTTPPSIQWQKSLGGSENDNALSIKQTNDGGYIVAGYSQSNDGNVTNHHGLTGGGRDDAWVVKLDSIGYIMWEKSYGGSSSDVASSIEQTKDGGYIFAGSSASWDGDITDHIGTWDCWVVKLDSGGTIQWKKSLGGSQSEEAYSIKQTLDGGYIFAGYTKSNDSNVTGYHPDTTSIILKSDYWIVKLDSIGNIQWQKCLGGTKEDIPWSIIQTLDSGYIVGGCSTSLDGDVTGIHDTIYGFHDAWVVKLNSLGNIQWQKCYGGNGDDNAGKTISTTDGGYIICGTTLSSDGDITFNHGTYDCWVVKIDTTGNIQWQRTYGGSDQDGADCILQTNDGGYIFAGITQSTDGDVTGHSANNYPDEWVVKIDSTGNIQWNLCLGGLSQEVLGSIQQTNDGGFIVAGEAGYNTGNHGMYDYWIVKLSPPPMDINVEKIQTDISIYPNPSYRNFTVNVPADTKYIQISNSLRQVIEKRIIKHQTESTFEISENGIYFIQIVTNKKSVTKKVVISIK